MPPAIALIEFTSIAIGTRAVDALVKKAPVTLIRVGSFQPGRFAVFFSGPVAEVDEAFIEGLKFAGDAVLDRLFLPDVHRDVYRAVLGERGDWSQDTLGIIETSTLSAAIDAADAAIKGALIEIAEIRLGDGLGGKGLVHLGGELTNVQAAMEIGVGRAQQAGRQIITSIISRMDDDLRVALSGATRYHGREFAG